MISRNLMGFGAASEQFSPPEIRITSRQHWPVFTPENDSRAPQWLWLIRTRRKEKVLFQVRGTELALQNLGARGKAPYDIRQQTLETFPSTARINREFTDPQ